MEKSNYKFDRRKIKCHDLHLMTKRHKIRFDILVCRKISDFVTQTTTAENGAPYLIKTNHKKGRK